jgi:hypothetical protein
MHTRSSNRGDPIAVSCDADTAKKCCVSGSIDKIKHPLRPFLEGYKIMKDKIR